MEMMTALSSHIGIAECSQVYMGGEHPEGLILSGRQRQMTPKTLPHSPLHIWGLALCWGNRWTC